MMSKREDHVFHECARERQCCDAGTERPSDSYGHDCVPMVTAVPLDLGREV